MLSVIGSDLNRSGLTSTAVSALADNGIELLGMQQPMRHVDLQFVIDQSDYDKGVAVLDSLRDACDRTQKTLEQTEWPFPIYREMLFLL